MLEIKNIQAGYGSKNVLDGLSLHCLPGEIHGILGWNGAGKTTFFNTVFGFLPLRGGEILLDGKRATKHDIAFLETEPFFYPNLRGREFLELVAGKNAPGLDHWQAVLDLPLGEFVNNYSTGMLKKLGIAGAFLQNRRVMLLDEPFNGLDLESSEKLGWLLRQTKPQGERIVLLSSHILPTLTGLCDKISRLENGCILKTYLPEDFPELEAGLRADVHSKLEALANDQNAPETPVAERF